MQQAKTMLVTGGAIGIGRATALAFARTGHHVVVTEILESDGAALVAAINAEGGSASFHALDVRSTEQADRVVRTVIEARGSIDMLVLNAGIAHKVPLARLTDEKWDHTVDIDLKGMFRVARAALPHMRARRKGAVVCLTSLMGVSWGWTEHVHYSAAKSGVIGLMRGLAAEVAPDGIRVNAVSPGYVRTAQLLSEEHSLGPAGVEEAAKRVPLGRVGEPDDIAQVILRGLASSPKLLVIDELSLGLAPRVLEMLFPVLESLNRKGLAILLVEQLATQALAASHRAYVMETGRVTLSGLSADLARSPAVRQAYLGRA